MQPYEPSWWRVIAASSARALLVLIASLSIASVLPAALGWTPTVVLTGSMEPALPVGSVLVSKQASTDQLKPGHVVTVEDPDQPGMLRTHRLVEVKPSGDLILKGDANQADDSTPVSPAAVQGVGALSVPRVGLPVVWWTAGQYGHLVVTAFVLSLAFTLRRADRPPSGDGRPPRLQLPWRRVATAGAATTVVAGLVVTATPFIEQSDAAFTDNAANPTNAFSAAATLRAYRAAVLTDSPYLYWRLNESSGTTAADSSSNGTRTATFYNTYTFGATSPITGEAGNTAVDFPSGLMTQNGSQTAPTTFTVEAWLKTGTTAGGRIIGFGSSGTTSASTNADRHLYLNPSGKIVFGVGTSTKSVITSPSSYSNGAWHHVVGTYTSGGLLRLYVNGSQVAVSSANVAAPTTYTGYWRAAAEDLSSWPTPPSGTRLAATLDEVAVYTTALSAARVSAHYAARTQ